MHLALAILIALAPSLSEAASNLRPKLRRSERYGETYTFVADLEDGSYVQLQLAVTNLGPGSGTGLCRILVAPVGKAPWHADERVPRDRWSWRGGEEERLEIGGCTATSGPDGTRVSAGLEGGKVELAGPPLAPVVPPGAQIAAGDASYQSRILIASGPVRASIVLPGEKTARTAKGGIYADQSRSDVAPSDLARTWVRFRSLRGDPPMLLLGREAPDGKVEPMWSLASGTFRSLDGYQLSRSGEGRSPSWKVAIEGEAAGRIASGALLYRHAPIESLGLLGRAVAPLVGSPVTFTYRAVLERDGKPDLPGILEVSLSQE